MTHSPTCRFCDAPLEHVFVDLGLSPLCESYVDAERASEPETFYPLKVYVCTGCWLVQLEEFVSPESIFSEYAYFSSYADSWVEHARRYVEMIISRLGLDRRSRIIELASNDGYLLEHFVAAGFSPLGIEPAANVARSAQEKGVETLVRFFGRELADELVAGGRRADLIIGNNVLAQVPDLNDFVAGMRRLLAPGGTITLEFPDLLRLMAENQFDTIYHEHFSYFSLLSVEKIFAAHELRVYDVEALPTHGGSLRIYACHHDNREIPEEPSVAELRATERRAGLDTTEAYEMFSAGVESTKRALLSFLIGAREDGRRVVGYGAPGKGNTLLNYCGVRTDFLEFTVDRNPYKQGKLLPGTRIPIHQPDRIRQARPDFVLILPWNFKDEIMEQIAYIGDWGGKFVVPIPRLTVIDASPGPASSDSASPVADRPAPPRPG